MLENPFKPTRPESETDPAANAKLVGEFLGPDAAKKYAELDNGREGKKADTREDLVLTDAEKAVVKEAKERWDRNRYIEWAASFEKDEEWVDETFIFYDDGRVECENLDLSKITELREFPSELTIRSWLDLSFLRSAESLIFPDSLKILFLSSLASPVGLTFPPSLRAVTLDSLESVTGLIFPSSLKKLFLDSLNSAVGLTIPPALEILKLRSLASLSGLNIPPSLKELYLPISLHSQVVALKEKGEIRGDIEIHYS